MSLRPAIRGENSKKASVSRTSDLKVSYKPALRTYKQRQSSTLTMAVTEFTRNLVNSSLKQKVVFKESETDVKVQNTLVNIVTKICYCEAVVMSTT